MNKRQLKKLEKAAQTDLQRLKKYEKVLARRGSIKHAMSQGTNTITWTPQEGTTALGQMLLGQKLIAPLVKDKGMREILAQNQDKYRFRLNHTITVTGMLENGQSVTVLRYDSNGNRTIPELVSALKTLPMNRKLKGYGVKDWLENRMGKKKGDNAYVTSAETFTLTNMTITTTIRQG